MSLFQSTLSSFCKPQSKLDLPTHRQGSGERKKKKDPNWSCIFAAGLPADIVGSQNFQIFSTRQTPHLVDWWGELTTTTTEKKNAKEQIKKLTFARIWTQVLGLSCRCSTHWATVSVGRTWILILISYQIFNLFRRSLSFIWTLIDMFLLTAFLSMNVHSWFYP